MHCLACPLILLIFQDAGSTCNYHDRSTGTEQQHYYEKNAH